MKTENQNPKQSLKEIEEFINSQILTHWDIINDNSIPKTTEEVYLRYKNIKVSRRLLKTLRIFQDSIHEIEEEEF